MKQHSEKPSGGLSEIGLGLDDLIRRGARQVIEQAIEAELAQLLEQYENVKTLSGSRAVVRNGYLPERAVLTAVGPVAVKVPKVRDRSGAGVKFNSTLVPPYVRRSARIAAALPWLVSQGHLHRRPERGAPGARGRGGPGPVPQRGEPPQSPVGRGTRALE